jgi:peptidoglycan/xylan/chitin deacetylase (PgdA/CDA1 family)
VRPRGRRASAAINLSFHGIGEAGRSLEPDEERYWVSPEQFDELVEAARRQPSVRLTFDDGNASDAEIALPALQRAGLTASFFVIAGRIGQPGSLDLEQVRELAQAGMTVGNHGLRHRSWRGLDDEGLEEELVEARATLAEAAGRPVDEAACPFGEYDRGILRALRVQGFRRVYTVDELPARAGGWLQPRYTIRSTDTAARIERLTRPGGIALAGGTLRTAAKRWR